MTISNRKLLAGHAELKLQNMKLKSKIAELEKENLELLNSCAEHFDLYDKKPGALLIRDLEQQKLGVTRFANKYCGDCTADYQVRLSAESMMYCEYLEQLKEGK